MDGKWTASTNEEYFHGIFDTREDAIMEYEAIYNAGDEYFVGRCKAINPGDHAPYGEWVLDHISDSVYDIIGDAADDWPDHNKEAVPELTRGIAEVVSKWFAKHCRQVFEVVDVEERIVGQELGEG